jgi:hypothetical protein
MFRRRKPKMKKSFLVTCIFLATFFMLWFMISCSGVNRDTCKNAGLISAIDPDLNQLCIEIPFGLRNHMMMGALTPNTVFLKDGHPATLSDFQKGDVVLVQWKAARNGRIIEFIGKGAEVADFIENK